MANGRPARGSSYGRASLGGLKNLMPGTGIEDGGFEETPSVEVTRPQGPTLTGESLPPEFKFNPGKYKPAKAKSGFADFLTGGESSRAASAQNMQAGLTMQQIAAAQAIQQAQMEADFARTGMTTRNNLDVEGLRGKNQLANTQLGNEGTLANTRLGNQGQMDVQGLRNRGQIDMQTLQNQGSLDVEGLRGQNQLSNTRLTGDNVIRQADSAMLNKFGMTSAAMPGYEARVNPHQVTRAEVEVRNALGFMSEPAGIESQRANYNATLRAPQAENYSKTRTTIQPNEQVLIPDLNGDMGGIMFSGNNVGEQVVTSQEPVIVNGKVVASTPKTSNVKTSSPGAAPRTILPQEEVRRREQIRLQQIQDAKGSVIPQPSGEYPVAGPQSFGVSNKKPMQANLAPEQLNALVNYLNQGR